MYTIFPVSWLPAGFSDWLRLGFSLALDTTFLAGTNVLSWVFEWVGACLCSLHVCNFLVLLANATSLAIFFSAAALAGSFGGLLAAAIGEMDGIGGKPGWAWIFIIEGLATIVIGVLSFWMVHDFPDEAKFLSDADKKRVLRRLAADEQSSAEHEEFKMSYFWASVRDWKTWTGAMIYMGADAPLYAFSLFTPTIIKELVSSPSPISVTVC